MWEVGGGGDPTRRAGREWASGNGGDSRSSTQLEQAVAMGSLWSHGSGLGAEEKEETSTWELDSRSRAAEGWVVGGSQPNEIHRRGEGVLVD